ncbi:hypothetical protein SAMN05192580_2573 [Sphingomonas jatrophae]|uniref:Uncharacterized protein n=1 Tax=Sphingomonas jatrophae TaxID=1166337 RepID=A0A1I6LCJ1_9SPHN|nr:hypothetical protein SAMN05192580_2573 [Sphingomonas jatrophae]
MALQNSSKGKFVPCKPVAHQAKAAFTPASVSPNASSE